MTYAYDKFNQMVNDELNDINFLSLFDRVMESRSFDPVYFKRLCLLTLFRLEHVKKNCELIPALMHYINILSDSDEYVKLALDQLLHIIAICDYAFNRQRSTNNLNTLYM